MTPGPKPRPILERVAEHVYEDENGCHVWMGALDTRGRPSMQTGSAIDGTRRPRRVHRLVWAAYNGEAAAGWVVHHDCENKLCVNIEHLRLMTAGQHSLHHDAAGNARKGLHR